MSQQGRARVDIIEIDLSQRVPSFPGIYGAMVLDLKKGEIGTPILNTSEASFFDRHTLNGVIATGDSLGLFEAQAFLRKSNKLWTIRPNNNAHYGGAWLSQDIPFHTIGVSVNQGLSTLNFRTLTDSEIIAADFTYSSLTDGDVVRVSAGEGGELPGGLSPNTPYYIIKVDEEKKSIQLALSPNEAYQGEYIPLTSIGSNVSIELPQDLRNGEQEYPVLSPISYQLDTSDGKPAGWESSFHGDFDGDSINVDAVFYATVSTGDELQMSGDSADLPQVDSGLPLVANGIVYAIKVPMEGMYADKYKIRIARTKTDALSEINIGLASKSGPSFALTITTKVNVASVNIDINQDTLEAESRFMAALLNNDRIVLSGTLMPTIAGGISLVAGTTYYAVTGTSGATGFRLTNERNGVPFDFETAGDTVSVTNLDKTETTATEIDLSKDTLVVDEVFYDMVETGYTCKVNSDGILPAGLVADTTYYIIKTDDLKIIKLASTHDNAELGITVDITDEGTLDPTLNQYHYILDTHNEILIGYDRKVGYIHTSTPCEEEIFYRTLHYPYGNEEDWSDSDQSAADTVKEPGAFLLWLYKQNSAGEMVEYESFLMSRDPSHVDGYGRNIYCEEVSKSSNLIRWIDNKAVDKSVFPVNQTTYAKLTQGDSGNVVTVGDAILSLTPLENKWKFPMTIIMDAGRNVPAFQQALIGLCEKRWTSMAILSTPISVEQSSNYLEDITEFRRKQLITSTSHAALYSPHLKIYDSFNDREIFVSPTGHVGAQISETAANYEPWFAPAGAIRGKLNVLGLSREFTEGDMDWLYDNQVNPIEFHEVKGIRIWGQKTLLTRASALDRVNVRMLLIVIEDSIADFLDSFVFEFNDEITRGLIIEGLTPYMDGIKRRRGVYDFQIVCDGTNNTAEIIDANELYVDVWVKPVKVAEFIKGRIIITKTGATFGVGL